MPSDPIETSRTNIKKRSIVINGHKTSVSLEQEYWDALVKVAGRRKWTLSNLVGSIDAARSKANLSSAIRLFILEEAIAGRLAPSSTEPDVQLATSHAPRQRKPRSPLAKRRPGRISRNRKETL